MSAPEQTQEISGPSVVDQQPTDVGVPKQPDLCGTFAVYLLPDGTAGLILDIEGEAEPRRQLLPQIVVEMVMYGKRPSPATIMRFMTGGGR